MRTVAVVMFEITNTTYVQGQEIPLSMCSHHYGVNHAPAYSCSYDISPAHSYYSYYHMLWVEMHVASKHVVSVQ